MKKNVLSQIAIVLSLIVFLAGSLPQTVQAAGILNNENAIITSGDLESQDMDVTWEIDNSSSARCQIISKSPQKSLKKKADFDAVWVVKNTSGKTWKENNVDYTFIGGKKMHKYNSVYDFPKSVASGKKITIRVDMRAPSSKGTYKTTWGIVAGSTRLCTLSLTVKVR